MQQIAPHHRLVGSTIDPVVGNNEAIGVAYAGSPGQIKQMPLIPQRPTSWKSGSCSRGVTLIATTLHSFQKEGFDNHVRIVRTGYVPPEKPTYRQALLRVRTILHQTKDASCVILNSASGRLHPDLLAIASLRAMGRSPAIVLAGEMWMPSRGLAGTIEPAFIKFIDPAVTLYAVHSTEELTVFPSHWGVAFEKMRLCPCYCDVDNPPEVNHEATEPYVFAGGNSKRDYEPLLEAAKRLPATRFVIATSLLDGRSLPPNVEARWPSKADYERLTAGASVVVVPVQPGMMRAAGQQTYLNAMSLGRIVIVNEALGVRDHIRHMVDGLVVDGSADSYVQAISFALDPANANRIQSMQEAAKHTTKTQFTRKRYVERLLEIALEAERISGVPSS